MLDILRPLLTTSPTPRTAPSTKLRLYIQMLSGLYAYTWYQRSHCLMVVSREVLINYQFSICLSTQEGNGGLADKH